MILAFKDKGLSCQKDFQSVCQKFTGMNHEEELFKALGAVIEQKGDGRLPGEYVRPQASGRSRQSLLLSPGRVL